MEIIMYFKEIRIEKWQQFKRIKLNFEGNLTVITGANASGKTTILNILATHHQWSFQSLATPKKNKKGAWEYITGLFGKRKDPQDAKIGSIVYSNNVVGDLRVPENSGPNYQILMPDKQQVPCFFIPSHRSVYQYEQVQNIPTRKKNKEEAFSEVDSTIRTRYLGGRGKPSSFLMKNTLIGWAINGYGVQKNGKYIMPIDEEQIRYYEGFQEVLMNLLPDTLGFQELEIRNMEIVFICNGEKDEFILETASGGICSLIDLAWQLYMFSPDKTADFTVIIDEIENHLHPTMQRRVLPDLIRSFPNVKFIVSTHSPLIVNSHKDAKVYVLSYDEETKIESILLDFKNHPKTANEILNDVLGVSTSLPIWVEDKLKEVIKNNKKLLGKRDFQKLRRDLSEIGFEKLFPETVDSILGGES